MESETRRLFERSKPGHQSELHLPNIGVIYILDWERLAAAARQYYRGARKRPWSEQYGSFALGLDQDPAY
jgi:hypothetical protein